MTTIQVKSFRKYCKPPNSVLASAKKKSQTRKKSNNKKHEFSLRKNNDKSNNPLIQMNQYKIDEKLLFQPQPVKDGHGLQVIYAYPNTYSVGITSLGYQLVWSQMAMSEQVNVARMFTDAHEQLPLKVDLLGFSLSWELDYVNIMQMLQNLRIPMMSSERSEEDPLVFGGGPVLTANPEPYAEFFDVVLVGDGEDLLQEFLDALMAVRNQKASRQHVLIALAQVPGVYVPSLYQPEYESDSGQLLQIKRTVQDVPESIKKRTYKGNTLAASTVVSPHMAWDNIFMVEMVRSCPEMCRFCLASYLTLPFRAASVDDALIPAIDKGLEATNRIGLLGASITQHPEFGRLLEYLTSPDKEDVQVSIASVRTNTVTEQLASRLSQSGTKSITVAVESGSERVRRIVNKKLLQNEVIQCAQRAQAGGLTGMKVYGMVGVPGEEQEDVQQTIDLMKELKQVAPKLQLTLGCSTFVPKAHTPFQWYGVDKQAQEKLKYLEKNLKKDGIDFRGESYKWSLVQALLARGDRRLLKLLMLMREYGDSLGSVKRGFKDLKGQIPDMEHYVHAFMDPDKSVLPWNHIVGPLPKNTLLKHLQDAQQEMRIST